MIEFHCVSVEKINLCWSSYETCLYLETYHASINSSDQMPCASCLCWLQWWQSLRQASVMWFYVDACMFAWAQTHMPIHTPHICRHFLGTLLSNHFLKEEGKNSFNFTELTRRDNEVLSKLFMCGSPRGKPQSFLTFSNQLPQKKSFPNYEVY